jgi:hypothetical protein
MKGTSMRSLSLIPAVLALFFSTAAYSQVWSEWADRENRFTVNFPGDPDKKEVPYKTAKGTNLTAHVFTAEADPKSRSAGTYSVTVVDYKTGSLLNARLKGKLKKPDEENPMGGDYWRQLVFYKILVDNLKSKDWKMIMGLIDFIEQDAKTKEFHQFPLTVSPEEVSTVRDQIKFAYDGIMNHRFYEGCGKEDCEWCNFVRDNFAEVPVSDSL